MGCGGTKTPPNDQDEASSWSDGPSIGRNEERSERSQPIQYPDSQKNEDEDSEMEGANVVSDEDG